MDDAPTTGEAFEYDMISELFGALNEAPDKDHGKILKSYLLGSIDTMREHTVFQLDLLEKLASIAINNVQDVRLYSLEARVREIEQGKPITFGQVMSELFFALAVEVAILASVTAAAPVVAGAGALLLANIKTSVRSPLLTRRIAVTKRSPRIVDDHRRDLTQSAERLLNRLHAPVPKRANRAAERKVWRERFAANKVDETELRAIRSQIYHLNQNREFHIEELVGTQIPLDTIAPQYQNITEIKLNNKIQGFIDRYAHHVDAGKSGVRAFSLLAQKKYPEAFSPPIGDGSGAELFEAFTTTGALVEMTRECETLKLDVIHHYAQQRAIMDGIEDDEVLDAFETVLMLEEVENNLFDTIDLSETMLGDLDAFVVPMELAVWLLYLEANNMLERETTPSRQSIDTGGYWQSETRFIGNDVVEEVLRSTGLFGDSPSTDYTGRRYAGLHALDEHQSYYLFHKFAKPAFALFADSIPKSTSKELSDFIHRDVTERAFDDVLSMPKSFFWSGENDRRRDLVKEMGVVVIEYFNFVRARVRGRKAFGFSDAVPEGTTIATLLDNIEKPELSEPSLAELPAVQIDDWLEEQKAATQLIWEDSTLAMFGVLGVAYEQAHNNYSHSLAMRDKYQADIGEERFNDLHFSQPQAQLLSARTAIEAYISEVESDQVYQSDAVDTRIEELKHILFNAPIDREMPSIF